MRRGEVLAHSLRLLGEKIEMAFCVLSKFSELPTTGSFRKLVLQVAIQVFIGIEVWTVTWQIVNFNLSLVFVQPSSHNFCVMNSQIVEDEK